MTCLFAFQPIRTKDVSLVEEENVNLLQTKKLPDYTCRMPVKMMAIIEYDFDQTNPVERF